MKNKQLVVFMPSIEGGGVEKNLFIITNFLKNKLKNVSLITVSKKHRNKFKKIKIYSPLKCYIDLITIKILINT